MKVNFVFDLIIWQLNYNQILSGGFLTEVHLCVWLVLNNSHFILQANLISPLMHSYGFMPASVPTHFNVGLRLFFFYNLKLFATSINYFKDFFVQGWVFVSRSSANVRLIKK